ncbi:MAG: DUF3060 domain-containing protein [Kofleriaceae bacterium]
MSKLASLIVGSLLLGAGAAAAEPRSHVVSDAGQTATLDCGDGGKVAILGADNTITLTGGCAKVAISGSGNRVTIEAVDKLGITGSSNTVTYQRGYTRKAPKVGKTGVGNKVSRAK